MSRNILTKEVKEQMNNRWRRIAFLKYGIKFNKDYKYVEWCAHKGSVYSTRINKPKSFRKGAKHYATKHR